MVTNHGAREWAMSEGETMVPRWEPVRGGGRGEGQEAEETTAERIIRRLCRDNGKGRKGCIVWKS